MRSISGSRQTAESPSRESEGEDQLEQWLARQLALAPPLNPDQLRRLQLLLAVPPTVTASSHSASGSPVSADGRHALKISAASSNFKITPFEHPAAPGRHSLPSPGLTDA